MDTNSLTHSNSQEGNKSKNKNKILKKQFTKEEIQIQIN